MKMNLEKNKIEESFYKIGDKVKINEIPWIVRSIRYRFGTLLTYDLDRTDGIKKSCSIEASSLETII